METKTELLEDCVLELDGTSATVADVLRAVAAKHGWQPVDALQRLEGARGRGGEVGGEGLPGGGLGCWATKAGRGLQDRLGCSAMGS